MISGKEAVAKLIGVDVAMGAGAEIVTTGGVSLEGFSMNLVMSALGHAYGMHGARAGRSAQTADNINYDVTQYTNREGFHEQLRDNQGNVVDILKNGAGEPQKMMVRGPEGDEIVFDLTTIPKGYVRDAKTGELVKVDMNKVKTKIESSPINSSNEIGMVAVYDEFGNNLGLVQYSLNGEVLKFEGLHSYVEGCGLGTKLISELKNLQKIRDVIS